MVKNAQSLNIPSEKLLLNGSEIDSVLDKMAETIADWVQSEQDWILVGIADGALALRDLLNQKFEELKGYRLATGTVNVSFHRDDIGHRPISKVKSPTHFDTEINGRKVILLDDVFYSGRTVKAALDELFENGRPSHVKLLVMIDRFAQVLPIKPDFAPVHYRENHDQKIKIAFDDEDLMESIAYLADF